MAMQIFRRLRFRTLVIVFAVLVPAAYFAGHFAMANSEAFLALASHLKQNARVKADVGKINRVSLALFQPQKMSWSALEGDTVLIADVEGETATRRYKGQLKKSGDGWRVVTVVDPQ